MVRAYANGLNINDDAIKKTLNNLLTREARKYEKAGKEAMKQLRTESTNSWYGYSKNQADTAMNLATEFKTKITQKKGIITINIQTYVNPRTLEIYKQRKTEKSLYSTPYSKIFRWRDNHEQPYVYNGIKHPALYMGYSVGQYIVHLQWDLGHVGLPQSSGESGTGWVNEHYKGRSPMKEHVESYVGKNWAERVMSIYKDYK